MNQNKTPFEGNNTVIIFISILYFIGFSLPLFDKKISSNLDIITSNLSGSLFLLSYILYFVVFFFLIKTIRVYLINSKLIKSPKELRFYLNCFYMFLLGYFSGFLLLTGNSFISALY